MKPTLPEGATAKVNHIRRFPYEASADGTTWLSRKQAVEAGIYDPPLAKGGMTIVMIETPNGARFVGASTCHERDNFNKAIGRMIATGRALKQLEEADALERAIDELEGT